MQGLSRLTLLGSGRGVSPRARGVSGSKSIGAAAMPEAGKRIDEDTTAAAGLRSLGVDPAKLTLDSIKAEFKGHGDGRVSLSKNDDTGVAKLVLHNPRLRSIISGRMMVDMADAMEELKGWRPGKGLVLQSDDPKFFSAGADLQLMKDNLSPEGGYKLAALMHRTLQDMADLPLLSLSLVRGRALAGSVEMCLATDLRVFSPSGSITFLQPKMGITTAWGAGPRLVRLLGPQKALKTILGCKTIGAKDALSQGLCDHITYGEGDSSSKEAEMWLIENYLHNIKPEIIGEMKSICYRPDFDPDLKSNLQHEMHAFIRSWSDDSIAEALERKIKLLD